MRKCEPYFLPLFVIFFPILAFAVSSGGNWFFDSGAADNWQGVRYFLGYDVATPGFRESLSHDYKSSRIGWNALGWLTFKALPTEAAQITLTTSVFVVQLIALYTLMTRFTTRHISLCVLVVAVCFPALHGNGIPPRVWNYHAGFANIFFLFGASALFYLSINPRSWLAAAAGAAFTIAVSTTLILAAFVGPAALVGTLYAFVKRPNLPWLRLVLWSIAGAIGAFTLLGLMSMMAGGKFYFIDPQVSFVIGAMGHNPWYESFSIWFPEARYLGFQIAIGTMSIGTVAYVLIRRQSFTRADLADHLAPHFFYLLCLIGMIACEVRGQNALQVPYFAFHLTAPAFLALTCTINLLTKRYEFKRTTVTVVLMLLVVIAPQLLMGTERRYALSQFVLDVLPLPGFVVVPIGIALVLMITVAASVLLLRSLVGFLALAASFGFISLISYPDASQYAFREQGCGFARMQMPFIADVSRYVLGLPHRTRDYGVALWMSSETDLQPAPGCDSPTSRSMVFTLNHSTAAAKLTNLTTRFAHEIEFSGFPKYDVERILLLVPEGTEDVSQQNFAQGALESGLTSTTLEVRKFKLGTIPISAVLMQVSPI